MTASFRPYHSDGRSATVRRLATAVEMTHDEMDYLEALQSNRAWFEPGQDIFREHDAIISSFMQREGWSYRWYVAANGRRQILNVYLPGDTIELNANFPHDALYTVTALTGVEMALLEPSRMTSMWGSHPNIAAALEWSYTSEMNVLSEHNISLGARSARDRILHLLIELWCRLVLIGDAEERGFEMPLTQQQIGEICGLSLVHTNKSISALARDGLLEWRRNHIVFPSVTKAMRACHFDPRFLDHRTRRLS